MTKWMLWDSRPPLWPAGLEEGNYPFLEWDPEPAGKPVVLVLPGGAYNNLAPHEGVPIAEMFRRAGFAAGVISYRVAQNKAKEALGLGPLLDVQRAIRLVRRKSGATQEVILVGFSAGGHLAASAGVHHQASDGHPQDGLSEFSTRPDALILGYPVIFSLAKTHDGSIRALCGSEKSDASRKFFCLNKQVGPQTPPSFLWHTANDALVPVENSIGFAEALSARDIPFALHIFSKGRHGLGLAEDDPEAACWPDLAITWLHGVLNRLPA